MKADLIHFFEKMGLTDEERGRGIIIGNGGVVIVPSESLWKRLTRTLKNFWR